MNSLSIGITAALEQIHHTLNEPPKRAVVDRFVTDLPKRGPVEVEITAVDTTCENCNGHCESGGPFDCYVCENSGKSDEPRIHLGRVWTADAYSYRCVLSDVEQEMVKERYFEEVIAKGGLD